MPENYELETREFILRAEKVDTEQRIIRGVAVPYEVETNIGGEYVERFAKGAVQDSEDSLLYWRHADPIGKLTSSSDSEAGWEIEARVSETTQGNDALVLARDGVVVQLSVGFERDNEYEVEEREDGTTLITRTKVRVREVSLVPRGAYGENATISEVRAASDSNNNTKEVEMTDNNSADLLEVRETVEELERKIANLNVREEEPVLDTRSAAEVLKALAKGDEATVKAVSDLQERAYTGGTTADATLKPGWVGDLTRIFDNSSGVLASIFETGALPADGMSIEYAQLKSNTVQVTEQVNEGDDLAYGKVTLETKTAPVKTYGGYVQLSRQAIDRSSLPVLNRSLEALAQAAAKRAKIELRKAFNDAVTARSAIASNGGVVLLGSTLATATYNNWVNAIVDASIKFDEEALDPDALVVSASVFKKMAGFAGSDGRPLLSLDGSGANTVGRLNITALQGSFANVPVVLDAGLTGDSATLVNGRAIRVYQSSLVSLQDENIINLSKDFSVYRYAAIATEIPAGIVPVKLAAS
ncbi:HK97 family phage prohead protease [Microbacterium paludicola]|uniref:HK97 family phage prohead protease n=1 Tax=Microbacterium paludicola TaxID=300019 RepID=UPI000903D1C8|nr:HK97 family phage prohead protease [Microbacterium paludicola]APF33383.1 hypothetical protein BO218_03525 [Microbacterium paludicola]